MSKTFIFTLERDNGYTYTYEGSFESLARHIASQDSPIKVNGDKTAFNPKEA